jgi:hypothetical protein
VWPHTGTAHLKTVVPRVALHSFSKAIEIPASLRDRPLDARETSARLTAVLSRFGVRVLGDLHGRKVVDFAWERNCGPKTLYELDLLARRARFQNGKASYSHRGGSADVAGSKAATAAVQQDAASFAIPESVCHLSFRELPITTRLANVARSMGARTLGDLNGRNAFELLQYKACGWRTISEIQQLIERAVSGQFDISQIEQATAVAELLSLLEQGLAKLPLRDRQFVLARIGAEIGSVRGPGAYFLRPSYAEIGRRYGLTRARVQKVFANTLDSLRKIWGPRVPRLLEVIRWRCLSAICPLTPQLLGKWVNSPAASSSRSMTRDFLNSFRVSMEAHVRLIAALDKNIPCWLETNHRPRRIDDSVRQFDSALAHVVRGAGGQITVAEAYRKLSHPGGRDYRRLTIENFLRMLWSAEYTVIEFTDPQSPIIRMRAWNGENFRAWVRSDQPSAPGRTDPAAIPFFGANSMFGKNADIGPR